MHNVSVGIKNFEGMLYTLSNDILLSYNVLEQLTYSEKVMVRYLTLDNYISVHVNEYIV